MAAQVTVGAASLPRVENREGESQQEKNCRQPSGELGQHVRCLGAEDILGDAAAKGRAESLAFRALHQDDEHHQERDKNVNPLENIDREFHLGRAISLNKSQKQTPNVQRPMSKSDQTHRIRF